jgi:BirA family biotin operon repressor/biotin-[acetyl-CoA-carboxylase] ligase
MAPAIDALDLRRRLESVAPGLEVQAHAVVASTNDLAMAWLREAAAGNGPSPPALLVCAERQTAGRGRFGRPWWSAAGRNLLFSLALPLAGLPPNANTAFNLAAAAIVCDRIERAGALRPAIKWPNDVHLGQRKIAGILSELAGPAGDARNAAGIREAAGIVVGIGINVNAAAEEFPEELRETAGSLMSLSGAAWDRQELLAGIAGGLLELAADRRAATWSRAADAWRARCDTLGRWVTIVSGSERIEGTALGLEEDGALVVRTAEGSLRRVEAGEVTLEKAQ